MTTERLWQAVLTRDRQSDGLFVYAVRSTRIYCRPSCASRRPRRDHVAFFPDGAMAAFAGYRACRRCRPDEPVPADPRTAAVSRVCRLVSSAPDRRWTSARLTRASGLTTSALQRAFHRTLGLTPRDYIAACRRRSFLEKLKGGGAVTDAIYESGYGSPSRVYGGTTRLGMTPATYGRGGAGATIAWTTVATSLGRVLVAATPAGVCFVAIGSTDAEVSAALTAEFPKATIEPRSSALDKQARVVATLAEGERSDVALPLDVRGTAFQWKVWRALSRIPAGTTASYRDVAARIGAPAGARAVARACATNPAALIIPCHRVVGLQPSSGGYRWGPDRKDRLIEREHRTSARET